ncbi:fused MFS/spermidine synthase [Roseovarius sp. CAU 1744]|uniref:fused MFS/spermidine synthase n=1 Tax=Roseovarius sp. CAU 1744 TaxID=3140368 RepID=UPI00325A95BE
MLFFQLMLLAGYVYAHLIVTYLSRKWQVTLHIVLLAVSLLFLPITPSDAWKPDGHGPPLPQISLLLVSTIGLPFLILAASAPLMQAWFTYARPGRSPYRLYALSNAGSFLGLLSYPFVIEPSVGLNDQTVLWSAVYAAFAMACAGSAILTLGNAKTERRLSKATVPRAQMPGNDRVMIVLLSAVGVVVLLSTTNQLCKDVAVVPLLWILPLTLYLASFIVAFGRPGWYLRSVWAIVLILSISSVVYLLHQDNSEFEVYLGVQVLVYSTVVFACCMVCHGEIYRLRPATENLTSFYLAISVGGALGGIFVNLIAPVIFLGYWEFHASLVATILLLSYRAAKGGSTLHARFRKVPLGAVLLPACLVIAYFLAAHVRLQQEESIVTRRSFFGILRVYEYDVDTPDHIRSLYHGRIGHGDQFRHGDARKAPITYYGPDSGIGVAIAAQRAFLEQTGLSGGIRMGVIGLGAATIAAYAKPGDTLRFYEIDPEVTKIAREYFTYLADAKTRVDISHGDGRITLERELAAGRENAFDVFVVDAFSGDAIPVHLLTIEALELYRRHLSADGIIAFHISNLHFDLRPVVRALAEESKMDSVWIPDAGNGDGEDPNDWMLLTASESIHRALREHAEEWPDNHTQDALWTDDFANLLGVLWHK